MVDALHVTDRTAGINVNVVLWHEDPKSQNTCDHPSSAIQLVGQKNSVCLEAPSQRGVPQPMQENIDIGRVPSTRIRVINAYKSAVQTKVCSHPMQASK